VYCSDSHFLLSTSGYGNFQVQILMHERALIHRLLCLSCLWFILEPIVKDGESHGVLYRILTSIKQSVDTQHPESSEANKKLYAMCDLAQVLIGSKVR
jgi:hypothetical protein